MILKFYKPEFGSPLHAREYCEGRRGQRDSNFQMSVVCGSAENFEHVACSLNFSQKYSSGIASWAKGDEPTEDQLKSFLDDFRNLAFAGLQMDRICWCVYLHSSNAKVDMHILIANVDLKTKKHFNPAPPGSKKAYDALRDMYNARFGWCSPIDPRFERIVRPDFGKYEIISDGQFNIARPKKRGVVSEGVSQGEVLRTVLQEKAIAKTIKNRAEVLFEIEKWGKVVAVSSRSIDVQMEKSAEIVRLKGLLFRENFTSEMLYGLAPLPRPIRKKIDHDADKNEKLELAARMVLKLEIERREQEHFDRYARRAMRKSAKRKHEYDLQEDSLSSIILSNRVLFTRRPSSLFDVDEMRYKKDIENRLQPVVEYLQSSFFDKAKKDKISVHIKNSILENYRKFFTDFSIEKSLKEEKSQNEKNIQRAQSAENALSFMHGLSDEKNNKRSAFNKPR